MVGVKEHLEYSGKDIGSDFSKCWKGTGRFYIKSDSHDDGNGT
jgi:hypothetical protein